jgi:hypothetical protein
VAKALVVSYEQGKEPAGSIEESISWLESDSMESDIILSRFRYVNIDRVWIGEWIYWQLAHTTRNYLFPASCVFSRSLAMAYNNRDSSALRAEVPLSQPPVQNANQLSAQLLRHLFWASLVELNSHLTTGNWTGCPSFLILNSSAPTA